MADKASQAEVKRKYPVVSGLVAGTTKQEGRISNLIPENSIVPARNKVGLS